MFLFFDTETTGLPLDWNAPVENLDNWPRVVQIAWIVYDYDEKKIAENQFIIKPEGFTIPDNSSNIHGITTEIARKQGKELEEILNFFYRDLCEANFLVAHNMSFDEKIVGAEFLRKKIDTNALLDSNKICTMISSRDFCKIPSANSSGYKWPKLSELYTKLFQKDFEDAHNAFSDTIACAKCFFELKNKGIISLPEIKKEDKILKQGNLFNF